MRVGRTFAARTYGDLAALTADLPAGLAAAGSTPARPGRPCGGRWPGRPPGRAAAWSSRPPPYGIALVDPGPTPGPIAMSWAPLCVLLAFFAVITALGILSTGWAPHWSSGAPAAAAPARTHGHAPAANGTRSRARPGSPRPPPSARTAPTCRPTSRRRPRRPAFPPPRAGRAPRGTSQHQARPDTGETSTGTVPRPLLPGWRPPVSLPLCSVAEETAMATGPGRGRRTAAA